MDTRLDELERKINFLALRSNSECDEAVVEALALIRAELKDVRNSLTTPPSMA